MKLIDLSGQRFGRLVVLSREGTKYDEPTWRCACDCGAEHVVRGSYLRNGTTRYA